MEVEIFSWHKNVAFPWNILILNADKNENSFKPKREAQFLIIDEHGIMIFFSILIKLNYYPTTYVAYNKLY